MCNAANVTWQARWLVSQNGLFHKTIWRGAARNCSEEGRHKKYRLNVCHHLSQANFNQSDRQWERATASRASWSIKHLLRSVRKKKRDILCSKTFNKHSSSDITDASSIYALEEPPRLFSSEQSIHTLVVTPKPHSCRLQLLIVP